MNKLATLTAVSALALSSQQALAEGNNTSPEYNQENASSKVEVVKKSVCDKTNLALACHKAGLVLPQEKYVENQNNIETAESMIDFSQLEKSSDIFSDVMFPNKDQLFTVSEDTPAELKNISDIRELYSNILMSRSTDRSPAWDVLFEKLELSEDKNLFIDFINQAVQNIKENHGDVEWIPTNVPQIYLEKSITASISALLNMPKEQTVVAGKVSEFTLRYLTDLTTALYLKGDIQESDIQVINNNGAYFATFYINEQTVSTLIDATQGKYSPLAVLQSMKTVGENLQKETVSLAGVPEDVLPDVEDQPIQNQKIFMKYFTEHTQKLSEDKKIDFGFDLADVLMLLQSVPEKTIIYAQEFQNNYNLDLNEIITLAEEKKVILDKQHEISENELLAIQWRWEEIAKRWEEIAKRWEEIAKRWEEIAKRWEELDRNKKVIDQLFAQLGVNK